MLNHLIPISRSFSFIFLASLHTHSLPPHPPKPKPKPKPKPEPTKWNTNHSFVKSNPLLSLLEQCTSMAHLVQLQAQMVTTGLILDPLASSRLVAFCALSESPNLSYSERVLKSVHNPKAFSWNVTIRGYSESGSPIKAIVLYKELLRSGGCRPDGYTYPLVFKACGRLGLGCVGRGVVGHVLKLGLDGDVFVRNGVVYMLVSCGMVESARKVFDESPVRDLVTWNSLINGYVHCGRGLEAVRAYEEMRMEGVGPDEVTMIGLVAACGQLEDLEKGKEFHWFVEEHGLNLIVPLCNALMDMYVKCGDLKSGESIFCNMKNKTTVSWTTMVVGYAKFGMLDKAKELFDAMPDKDVVPWNAMIGAYVQAQRGSEALDLFHEMQDTNVRPDEVTMVHCLSACSQLGALDIGVWIHHYVNKHNLSLNAALGTALVDMYAKCGNIGKSLEVFHEMPVKNSMTWTALIGGLALNGNTNDALSYFSTMIDVGLDPDEITFLGVLAACCHGGLVDEGRKYFAQMTSKYKLTPKPKHYSCMVDLLGRAGRLQEAEALIESMPIEPDAVVWGALFFACRMHGNVTMGERAAWKLLELDPGDGGIYVLLANMYGDAEMWDEARKVRKTMKTRGVEKTPGRSSIEIDGVVNDFTIRDKTHPDSEEIYTCLVRLTKQLELPEYNPWTTVLV